MNKLVKTVGAEELYIEFANVIRSMLNLTERETELIAELMSLDRPSKTRGQNVVSTENRKILSTKLGIRHDNLSRMINKFKRDGILVKGKSEHHIHVWPPLVPEIIGERVQLTVVLKIKE